MKMKKVRGAGWEKTASPEKKRLVEKVHPLAPLSGVWLVLWLALAATAAAGDVAYVLRDPGLNHMPVLEIKVPDGYAVKGTVGWNLLLEPVMCGARSEEHMSELQSRE